MTGELSQELFKPPKSLKFSQYFDTLVEEPPLLKFLSN